MYGLCKSNVNALVFLKDSEEKQYDSAVLQVLINIRLYFPFLLSRSLIITDLSRLLCKYSNKYTLLQVFS